MRIRQTFVPDFVEYYGRYSLMERNDTHIKIFEQHVTRDAPYSDTFQTEVIWDILTADPQSHQTVFRKSYFLHWFEKPLVWKLITKTVDSEVKGFNDSYPAFFQEATAKYLEGPPYAELTTPVFDIG